MDRDCKKLIRTAMTRVALAIQACGENLSDDVFDELLRHPEDGKLGGTGLTWWPDDETWSSASKRQVSYYYEQFRDTDAEPEIKELLGFGLFRRVDGRIGFMHDSFVSYFTGVLALRHFHGPVLPGGSLPKMTAEWVKRIAMRLVSKFLPCHHRPRDSDKEETVSIALTASDVSTSPRTEVEFLSGVLTAAELRELLLELIPLEPSPGLPALIQTLLQCRRPGGDRDLLMLDDTLNLPEVQANPETLFCQCHDDLQWPAPDLPGAEMQCRETAKRLREKMPRPWLHCRNRGPRAGSAVRSHTKAVDFLVELSNGHIASKSEDGTVLHWCPNTCDTIDPAMSQEPLQALAELPGGSIDSIGRSNGTKLEAEACATATLKDGRVAFTNTDNMVRLRNPNTGQTAVFDVGARITAICCIEAQGRCPMIVVGTASGRVLFVECVTPDVQASTERPL